MAARAGRKVQPLLLVGVVHGGDVFWRRLARYFFKGFMEGYQSNISSLPTTPLF
jgi:hypothetical protein